MRDLLTRRLTMLQATLRHFDDHPDVWKGAPAIARTVATVRERTADIEGAAEDQAAANPTGLTKDKREARDVAEHLLGTLADAAAAYAIETGDDDFDTDANITRADWDRMADARFFARAETALDRFEGALDTLTDYDVTRDEVAAARAAVEAARPLGSGRDTVRAGRVVATAALDGGYSAVAPTLKLLDHLVRRLVKDAEFVARYVVVRRIPGA
jgi:hypothetical protein